jgi:uncharacterized membrane protein
MKPLLVLLVTFIVALSGVKIFNHSWNFIFAGNAAMSSMLFFTATGHFVYSKGMAMMIPGFIPYKTAIVYFTGIIEIAAAICLSILSMRHITALLLIIFFILILPANINAAIHKVDYQKGTYEGMRQNYLWFRVPLQVFLILWIGYFGL